MRKKTVVLSLLLAMLAFAGADTWYSVNWGMVTPEVLDFFDTDSWTTEREVFNTSYTRPDFSDFHENHTWVVQAMNRMMVSDEAESNWLGSGAKIIVEYDADKPHPGEIVVETYLGGEDDGMFNAIELHGNLHIAETGVLRTANVTVFANGDLGYETEEVHITTLNVYENGSLSHLVDAASVPGSNRYFANSNNGSHGNGDFLLYAQGTDGLDTGITWGNVYIFPSADFALEDSLNANGAFSIVNGDLCFGAFANSSNQRWEGTYYLMSSGTAEHNISGDLILYAGNLCLKSGANSATVKVNGDLILEEEQFDNDYPSLWLSQSGHLTLKIRGDLIVKNGSFTATDNTDCSTTLYVEGKIDIFPEADHFRAYSGSSSGKGYLEIVFSNDSTLGNSSDLRLKSGLDRYACRWSITVNDGRTITLKSDVEIGTTNHASTNRNMYFYVKGTLKMGQYRIKNGSGTYESGNEPLFYLWSAASLYIADADGIAGTDDSGAVRLSGNRIYDAGADYYYVGTTAQTTGDGLSGARYLKIDNSAGVTLSADISAEDIMLQNGKLDPNGMELAVTGTLYTTANGSLEPGTGITVNGYDGHGFGDEYLSIAENEHTISNFSLATNANGTYFPQRIDRSWTITGTISSEGYKELTFRWTEEDDNGFTWGGTWPNPVISPVVYQGGEAIEDWSIYMGGRYATRTIGELTGSKGVFTIGRSDGQPFEGDPPTLPVELSSFTASISAGNNINLCWVTQSETGVHGFRIFRAQEGNLVNALSVSPLIGATNSSQTQIYVYEDTELDEQGTYYYWLQSTDLCGSIQYFGPVSVDYDPGNGVPEHPDTPVKTCLKAAYPNPFNPFTFIPFGLRNQEHVCISIYNQRGQMIRCWDLGIRAPGSHRIEWDGNTGDGEQCPSGIYLIRMKAGSQSFVSRVVLSK